MLLNGITATTPILDDVERSEADRSAASSKIAPASPPSTKPDPEFTTDAKRRTFTAEYKLRILEEADAAAGDGMIGASCAASVRRAHSTAENAVRSRALSDLRDEELRKLRRENERLAVDLRKAHLVIEVQEKVALLWERQVGPEEKS